MNAFNTCKAIILSTNKASNIRVSGNNGKLEWKEKKSIYLPSGAHLYIVSDEDLKAGDWCITNLGTIEKFNLPWKGELKISYQQGTRVIIASTNPSLNLPQPSLQFIQKYIEEYNKSNVINEVMVEYEDYNSEDPFDFHLYSRVKINPDNTINIKQLKDSWTRKEIESAIYKAEQACNLPHDDDTLISRNFLEQFLNL